MATLSFEALERLRCPLCGASTCVETHCPALDHPELTVEFFSCNSCHWKSEDWTPIKQREFMQPDPAPATDYTVDLKTTETAIELSPAPVYAASSAPFVDTEETAEKEREEAFDADHFFKGKKLHGYSITRDALWHRLRAGWPQLPALNDEDYANLPIEVTEPEAWITLFLCSHTPDDWAEYRHDTKLFITKIEAWVDSNIATREEQIDAITLGLKIRRQSRTNLATARNSGGTGGK